MAPVKLVFAIALVFLVLYFIKAQRRKRALAARNKPAAGRVTAAAAEPRLSVNEILAGFENKRATETPTAAEVPLDFEESSINKLTGYLGVLRELQIHSSSTEQILNAQAEEFDSGVAAIERMSSSSIVSNDNSGKQYDVLLYLAYREYVKLAATQKGRDLLKKTFGVA